jgi:signal transduction histidine kinase
MSLRLAILTAMLAAAVVTGPAAAANDGSGNPGLNLDSSQARRAGGSSRPATKAPPANSLASKIHAWFGPLLDNKEFLIYGGIASFGILMMGLAIGGASANPKSKTEAQLELLRQEKEKAENLARLKAEFLNQVSHELRTPLAVIIGYIECITDGLYGEIEAKHQEILQVVAKQSSHLKNMIDQILIYSRLEAGKQPLRIEDLQLGNIVGEMRDTFDFLCRQKGIDMRWDIPNDPMTIRSDLSRVKEAISNLIQNAVKYTDRGSVTVRIEKLPSKDAVLVEVTDTGMGISEHHLASIFEPFMQAHKTSSENSRGGIGLGLSIVKKHVEQINGTIHVESELGKGSTFRIVLPKNSEKSRSRAHRLLGFLRLHSRREQKASATLTPQLDAGGHQSHKTGHAIG